MTTLSLTQQASTLLESTPDSFRNTYSSLARTFSSSLSTTPSTSGRTTPRFPSPKTDQLQLPSSSSSSSSSSKDQPYPLDRRNSNPLSLSSLRRNGLSTRSVLPLSLLFFSISLLLNIVDYTFLSPSHSQLARDLVASRLVSFDVKGEIPPRGWRDSPKEIDWFHGGSGESPWDWDVTPGGMRKAVGSWKGRGKDGRVRVLFLISFQDYLDRMNTHTPELISAALHHPNVETEVYGPGYAGWNSSLSISGNLAKRRKSSSSPSSSTPSSVASAEAEGNLTTIAEREEQMEEVGCGYYDLVWTISDIFKTWDENVDNPGCGTLFVQQLGDCHLDDCINKWYANVVNITVVKYPHELVDMFQHPRIKQMFPLMEMPLFGHSPDSANRWDFFPPVTFSSKTVNASGFGYDGSFYPIRTTITNAHKGWAGNTGRELSKGISWYHHPGYNVERPEMIGPPDVYDEFDPLQEKHRALRGDFAGAMRETRICVFDSSLERKLIRKFSQAFLSGCVVASDLPTDIEDDISEFMIELKPSWSIGKIQSVLDAALADPAELQRKALLGFAYAREHLSNGKKVENMLGLWERYKKGERGYQFQSGFSLKCRQYWDGEQAYRPPWCSTEGKMGLEGVYDRAHEWD